MLSAAPTPIPSLVLVLRPLLDFETEAGEDVLLGRLEVEVELELETAEAVESGSLNRRR